MRCYLALSLALLAAPVLTACGPDEEKTPVPPSESVASQPSPAPADEYIDDQATAAQEEDNFDYDGLPPGPGREEVFVTCSACHSLKLVQQQGLSRHRWEEILDWMVEEQGMTPLNPPEHDLVINYLITHYVLPQ